MEKRMISTSLGPIAVYEQSAAGDKLPVVLLHGVYFDHRLWDDYVAQMPDRPVFVLDMPLHGASQAGIRPAWTLADCATMLLDVLAALGRGPVVAVGHSWGSMTIARAADQQPDSFAALGLCNMPFRAASARGKLLIRLQHLALPLREFYMRQAAHGLLSPTSLARRPDLVEQVLRPMRQLTGRAIRHTDRAVRIDAPDATALLGRLRVPARALVGAEDYVGMPPLANTQVVPGGHVSPLEAPAEVSAFLRELLTEADGGLGANGSGY